MSAHNKQLVSVRLGGGDLARIKRVATRLGVRDSDVIRFALRTMLTKLAPLHNENLRGSELLPALIEIGAELTQYFEMDSTRLDALVNEGVTDPAGRVTAEDLQLLCMAGLPEPYVYARLRDRVPAPVESIGVAAALRLYLFEKYAGGTNRRDPAPAVPPAKEPEAEIEAK